MKTEHDLELTSKRLIEIIKENCCADCEKKLSESLKKEYYKTKAMEKLSPILKEE